MFVLEYIKKKNFLSKRKKAEIIIETDLEENEDLNLAKFREEISAEIGAFTPKNREDE